MRVILDSNVLIASVAGRGLCESLLELCLEERELIVSETLIEEVQRALVRRIRLPTEMALDFCRLLRDNATMATPASIKPEACRDPNDLHLLGLAEATKADFLVTGDKDLIDCPWRGATRIVTPRQFWEVCRQKGKQPTACHG